MKNKAGLILFLLSLCLPLALTARSLDGVDLPDKAMVDGSELLLNGMGTRKATAFKVKVYVMGLYLKSQQREAAQILADTGPKRIVMQFVRDVEAGKIRDGWQQGFEKNAPDFASLQPQIDAFNAAMSDMKKGDALTLDFAADTVTVAMNGAEKGRFKGSAFVRGLLSIWLGPEPPNKELKAGILGG
jgi:hypothetical protein